MKAPKEVKQWIAKARSVRGKKNGVVSWLWENPKMFLKMVKSKRFQLRKDPA